AAAFRPPWWCRNGHLQTIWSSLFRRDRIRSRRERIATRDGDFVDLDWVDAARPAGAPLLLVLHGLEGSSRSHYSVGLMRLAAARGWRACSTAVSAGVSTRRASSARCGTRSARRPSATRASQRGWTSHWLCAPARLPNTTGR